MADFTHKFVHTNGIRMHVAEAGSGYPVVLCHGFPELWYSWRHQMRALADAGFRAIAPDQRGYGETTCPQPIEAYTQRNLVADLTGMLDALGLEHAVVVGHDWGGAVAWNAAMMAPARFTHVIGVNTPFFPRAPMKPTDLMRLMAQGNFHYILYFQDPGVAEAELERDVRRSLRGFYRVRAIWLRSPTRARLREFGVPLAAASWTGCPTVRRENSCPIPISRSSSKRSKRPDFAEA